jgi:MFS family permease|tara:strand:- start:4692 stop:5894 length:1203 start_codon:yes stop_codon:yes gene_type:complete
LPLSPHYRWTIVALTLVNQAVSVGIIIYCFALFVVPWLEAFAISRGQMMLAIFCLQATVGLVSPLLGRLFDQYSIRNLVITGALSISLGLFGLSQAKYFWQVVIIYASFLPVGLVLCGTLASQTLVSKWFTSNRSLAIGISASGTSIGGFIFPLLTVELIIAFEWQTSLLVLSVISLMILVPLNLFALKASPPAREAPGGKVHDLDLKAWTSRQILGTRMFWIPVVGLIPINAAFGGVQFNLGAYVSDLGFDQQAAAQLIAITALTMIFGKFMFGGLGDRVDHRKLYWLMVLLLAGSLVLYQGSPGWTELVMAASLQGLATGGVMPMMGIIYSSRFGTFSFGRVLGFVNMFLMIGSFGSIFSGWIFDIFQSYDYAFRLFLVLLVPCAVAMFWLPEREEGR